jgi:hypothetical protein
MHLDLNLVQETQSETKGRGLSGSTERIGDQGETFGVTTDRNIGKQESIISNIKKEVESPKVKIKVKKEKKKKRGSPP